MGGYIGSNSGTLLSNAAERKQTYSITTATTSLTGLAYTPTKVHVFHNGVRLVDGTDYTATNGTSITLTNAAQNGDEVVVISYPSFQTSDTVSAANGGTFAGNVEHTGTLTASSDLNAGTIKDATGTNTALTINSNGFVSPKTPTFSALTSGSVTVSSGYSDTKLTFDTEEWDVGGYFDTSTNRYTPLVAGYYLVTVSAGLTSTTPCRTKIFKNGSLERGSGSIDSAAYGYNNAIVTALVSMNGSSDYLEGYIQASGSGTVPSGKFITFFQAHLVGAL